MKKFVCLVCGYVHTGDEPPASCPICGAGADQFKEMPAEAPAAAPSAPAAAPAGERVWADEHRVGIAKGCLLYTSTYAVNASEVNEAVKQLGNYLEGKDVKVN